MRWKRTTAPDGIPGSPAPPKPTDGAGLWRLGRAALEVTRARRALTERPTLAQLRTLAVLGGTRPASYPLDRERAWLPESLPTDFPHGAVALRVAHVGGEMVVLPDGCGFSL